MRNTVQRAFHFDDNSTARELLAQWRENKANLSQIVQHLIEVHGPEIDPLKFPSTRGRWPPHRCSLCRKVGHQRQKCPEKE